MRWKSRSSVALLAAVLASACAVRGEAVKLVSSEVYASKRCWFDKDGSFAAFLVLAEDDRVVVPYAVSTRCLVTGDYSSYGEAVLHHLNTILMIDSFNMLQQEFPRSTVSDNLRSDQPLPSSDSKLFYINAKLIRVRHPYKTVYALKNIKMLKPTNVTFDRFLSMDLEERKVFSETFATTETAE